MQRQRISLDNLLHLVEDANLPNFVLLLDEYGKEYTIENYMTKDEDTSNTIDLIRRRVFMYPPSASFKIVLKPTATANGSSVRTFYFSREAEESSPRPQKQMQGLGGLDSGLGAVERIIEAERSAMRKEAELSNKALKEDFALLLEKNRLKDEKSKFREERRQFEDDKKFAIAKKLGEGLGAAALSFAQQHPALAGLLGQLTATAPAGLGAADYEEEEEEEYNATESVLEDLQDGSISIKELERIINERKYVQKETEESTEEY